MLFIIKEQINERKQITQWKWFQNSFEFKKTIIKRVAGISNYTHVKSGV